MEDQDALGLQEGDRAERAKVGPLLVETPCGPGSVFGLTGNQCDAAGIQVSFELESEDEEEVEGQRQLSDDPQSPSPSPSDPDSSPDADPIDCSPTLGPLTPPRTPDQAPTDETSFICLTSPEQIPHSSSIPLLLLVEDEDKPPVIRRSSAPTPTVRWSSHHSPSTLSLRSFDWMDASRCRTGPVGSTGEVHGRPLSGSSTYSTSTTSGVLSLESVSEDIDEAMIGTESDKERQVIAHVDRDQGEAEWEREQAMKAQRRLDGVNSITSSFDTPGPVPSGPNSPTSPASLPEDGDVDDYPLALGFPRPPGRILSILSTSTDLHSEDWHLSVVERPTIVHSVSEPLITHRHRLPAPDEDTLSIPVNSIPTTDRLPSSTTSTPPTPSSTPSPSEKTKTNGTDDTVTVSAFTPSSTPASPLTPFVDDLHPPATLGVNSHPEASTTTKSSSSSSLPSSSSSSFPSSLADDVENNTSTDRNQTMGSQYFDSAQEQRATSLPASHPFHHKASPSVPSSAQTASVSSTPTLDTPATLTSSLASPPTSWSQLSRRQSKFTAFSGSSASSIYSADSRHSAHHWTVGEKPDISTVFEEDSQAEYDIDLATTGDHLARSQSEGILSPAIDFGRSQPKDLGARGGRQQTDTHHPPSSSVRYPKLHNQTSLSSLVSQQSNLQQRAHRSDTISSQASAGSSKSTGRSAHPFASPVVRPTSPPVATFLRPAKSGLTGSKSLSNLTDTYRMQPEAPAHQVTLSSSVIDDVEQCPVCLEGLDGSFRLPGEKGFIVAECGHAVHQACFVLCYGDIPPVGSRKYIGVCGICRQPMRVAEIGGRKKTNKTNKLASLTGQNAGGPGALTSSSAASIHSAPAMSSSPQDTDPTADDPLETSNASTSRSLGPDGQPKVVVPSITIKSEFPTIPRSKASGKAQLLTAMITIAVPPAGHRAKYPARPKPFDFNRARPESGPQNSPRLPPSPQSTDSRVEGSVMPTSARSVCSVNVHDPFAHVLADLKHRLVDYGTSGLDSFGTLRLFDLLSVRKGSHTQEFHMYLFQKAVICISEEKKSSFRSIFSSSSSSSTRSDHSSHSASARGVLRLKGRIHLKHVQRIVDTSLPGELSLTIYMLSETMEPCVLVFRDRGSHETWKRNMTSMLEEVKEPPTHQQFDSSKKIAKLMGAGAPTPISAGNQSAKSFSPPSAFSATSYGDMLLSPSSSSVGHATTPATSAYPSSPATETTAGDLAYVAPLAPVHTPLDVVIILSLPASTSAPGQGSIPLKTRLMRQSLAFVLATMGPRDRIALVACEMGVNGTVRKTPFLNTTKYESRRRLEAFVETLGNGHHDDDEFQWPVGPDEKMDVVTAMNVALDVVLQRKARNPLGGMILISDTSDSIKRAQMDLVTARLDAANIPVHAIGYGKGHEPSPLWMISNHTFGTYTFVREWYDLRGTLAGIVGGMMNIAVTKMKVHLSCQEEFITLKTAGSSHSLIGQNGKEVDLELRELRFGETREILVELDLVNFPEDDQSQAQSQTQRYSGGSSGSERAGSRLGISSQASLNGDGISTSESGVPSAVYEDVMIDEWPVTEVDCSWHDPAAGRSVARLSHPVLLTVAILPPKAPPSSSPADPTLIRRRMEILASDMITRALLIASRKNYAQAARILSETKRIIDKVAQVMSSQLSERNPGNTSSRTKREDQMMASIEGMGRVCADLEILIEGLEENPDMFERDYRNFAAQQAVVLRLQKSWTARTLSEAAYCTPGTLDVVRASAEWTGSA